MKESKPKIVGLIMTYQCAHLLKNTFQKIPKGIFNENELPRSKLRGNI